MILTQIPLFFTHTSHHQQTDCFDVSQLISVAKPARCFKLWTKPGWLYAIHISYRRAIGSISISKGILRLCIISSLFTHTPAKGVLNSFEELCISRVETGYFFRECPTLLVGSIYIVNHRKTVSLYQNSAVWLAASWDRNPADYACRLSYRRAITSLSVSEGILPICIIFLYLHIHIVRRTRHAGHCWRSRDELTSDVLLWASSSYGRAKTGWPARTYIQQLGM